MAEHDWEQQPQEEQGSPEKSSFQEETLTGAPQKIPEDQARQEPLPFEETLGQENVQPENENSGVEEESEEKTVFEETEEAPVQQAEPNTEQTQASAQQETPPFYGQQVGYQQTGYQQTGYGQYPYSYYGNGYQNQYTRPAPPPYYGYQQPTYQTQNAYQQPYGQQVNAPYRPPVQPGAVPPIPPQNQNGSFQGMPGQPPKKKKMKKQTKIFLWIVGILLVALAIGFCVYGILWTTGTIGSGNGGTSSSLTPAPERGDAQVQLELEEIPGEGMMTPNQVYEKVRKSVVAVVTYSQGSDLTDSPMMSGSGIVFSQDGYIVTNSHVVGDTNLYPVKVVINGDTEDQNKEYPATVVGYDKRTDVAVLKINANDLIPAEFANSDELRVGDTVLSLGNPGVSGENFTNTLTKGMVSAVDRTVNMSNLSMKYIQTDAAINPGSSGGALLNLYGQVVGINAAKITTTEVEGICFAIPMNIAKDVINDLVGQGYVTGRVRLGVTIRAISSYEAQMYNVPQGLVIAGFSDDSTLPSKGAQVGDIITKIDGVDAISYNALYNELEKHNPGDVVKLTVYRQATTSAKAQTFEVEIPLLEDKGETQQSQSESQDTAP